MVDVVQDFRVGSIRNKTFALLSDRETVRTPAPQFSPELKRALYVHLLKKDARPSTGVPWDLAAACLRELSTEYWPFSEVGATPEKLEVGNELQHFINMELRSEAPRPDELAFEALLAQRIQRMGLRIREVLQGLELVSTEPPLQHFDYEVTDQLRKYFKQRDQDNHTWFTFELAASCFDALSSGFWYPIRSDNTPDNNKVLEEFQRFVNGSAFDKSGGETTVNEGIEPRIALITNWVRARLVEKHNYKKGLCQELIQRLETYLAAYDQSASPAIAPISWGLASSLFNDMGVDYYPSQMRLAHQVKKKDVLDLREYIRMHISKKERVAFEPEVVSTENIRIKALQEYIKEVQRKRGNLSDLPSKKEFPNRIKRRIARYVSKWDAGDKRLLPYDLVAALYAYLGKDTWSFTKTTQSAIDGYKVVLVDQARFWFNSFLLQSDLTNGPPSGFADRKAKLDEANKKYIEFSNTMKSRVDALGYNDPTKKQKQEKQLGKQLQKLKEERKAPMSTKRKASTTTRKPPVQKAPAEKDFSAIEAPNEAPEKEPGLLRRGLDRIVDAQKEGALENGTLFLRNKMAVVASASLEHISDHPYVLAAAHAVETPGGQAVFGGLLAPMLGYIPIELIGKLLVDANLVPADTIEVMRGHTEYVRKRLEIEAAKWTQTETAEIVQRGVALAMPRVIGFITQALLARAVKEQQLAEGKKAETMSPPMQPIPEPVRRPVIPPQPEPKPAPQPNTYGEQFIEGNGIEVKEKSNSKH